MTTVERRAPTVRAGNRARTPARALVALTVLLIVGEYVVLSLSTSAPLPSAVDFGGSWPLALFALTFAGVGGLVAARRPRNPIGWVFAATGLLWALGAFASAYAGYVFVVGKGSRELGRVMLWAQSWYWFPAVTLTGTFVVLLFPDGHLVSRRWRPVAWIAGVGIAVGTAASAFAPGKVENFTLDNPFALNDTAWRALFVLSIPAVSGVVVAVVAAVASFVVRYRSARGERRAQLKWFAYAVAIVGVTFPTAFLLWNVGRAEMEIGMAVAIAALPICAGIGILRYRLYDIDLVINRTLVYGGLTAALAALYVATVELLGLVVSHRTSFWPAAAATAVVIALAQPLRTRLQRGVNQLLYGERDDPYAAMSRLGRKLGETLAPGDVLAAVVESIAQALRVPYVAIEIDDGGPARTLAQHGTRRPVDEETIPLTYRGEIVGELVVATRAPGERFDARDRRLLEDLARQTGIAVNSVRVMEELQRSRQQLVTAREEERRRIRRDLHDGLGPTLAGIALNLDAARRLVEEDPPAAEAALVRLRRETQAAVSDIRRLVYELRPPALDELGLVGALREQAAQLSTNGFLVSVEAPEAVPRLAAATEVAAYRIALEAITNAARHADAQTCSLRVSFDGMLALEVDDDGKGLGPDCRPGVGTKSMQERAEELGGTCTIESTPSRGTHVSARLPLSAT